MKNPRPHLVLALGLLTACGGGDGPTEPPPSNVSSVTVTPASPTLEVGKTQQFSAQALDSRGSSVSGLSVTWSSSNTAVATINANGLANGVGQGTTAITATAGGVSGSQVLTVIPDQCEGAITVVLSPGQFQSYDPGDCLLLPSGANGNRYRVAILRTNEISDAQNVVTAKLEVTGIGVTATTAAPADAPAPVAAFGDLRLDGAPFVRALELRERTRRFHQRIRERELEFDARPETLLPSRPLRAAALLADPPAKLQINAQLTCSGTKNTHELVAFNDDLAIYQDSVQRAGAPISLGATNRLLSYYSAYTKPTIADYFGTMPDIDGNGRVVLTTSTLLADTVAASVFSGDLRSTCANGNRMEIMYFSGPLIREMDDANPNWAALGTMSHEAKHIVSLYHRLAASTAAGSSQFHPIWMEEGTAEIAESTASQVAWAANGGPPLGTPITAQNILATVQSNNGRSTPELWGVIEKLANMIVALSTHPNSLITNPSGASEFFTFYATSWHFHRFLADGFFNAQAPKADAPSFRAMADSSAATGVAALAQATGRSYGQLLEDMVVAMLLELPGTQKPARKFTNYDWVTATDIFASPEVLAPPGVYPWPVTTTSGGTLTASFRSATFQGQMGPASARIHDFLSNGTGTGAQVVVDVSGPAVVVVARLR